MFWKKDKMEQKIEALDYTVRLSFSKVKSDTKSIFQWLDYLYKKTQFQDQLIRQLNYELSLAPKNPEDIKKIVDSYYSYEGVLRQISLLNSRVDDILTKQNVRHEATSHHTQPVIKTITDWDAINNRLERLEHKKISIREKIMKRLAKNSKNYVTSTIHSHIKKYESISATQLKEMIVDEQSLCSKSSFYRLLGEIENKEDIGVIRKGKEKQYFHKLKNL